MPVNINTISVARQRFGDSSELNEMVFGIRPPRPMPVMSLRMNMCVRFCAPIMASVLNP